MREWYKILRDFGFKYNIGKRGWEDTYSGKDDVLYIKPGWAGCGVWIRLKSEGVVIKGHWAGSKCNFNEALLEFLQS